MDRLICNSLPEIVKIYSRLSKQQHEFGLTAYPHEKVHCYESKKKVSDGLTDNFSQVYSFGTWIEPELCANFQMKFLDTKSTF